MPSTKIDNAFTSHSLNVAAEDPTYAGVPSFMRRKYTKSLKGADVVVLGIPFDAAVSNRPGARFGPQAVRRASCIFDNDPQYPFNADLFENLAVIDYGDVLLDYGNHHQTPKRIEKQASKIITSGSRLISIGGDHYVTWPLLQAHYAHYGEIALIQFDAHQDTWFDDGKRIDHGSFVGRAVHDKIIDPAHSIQIGIRTHAPEDCGIKMLYGYDVEDMSISSIVDVIKQRVGHMPCYITFDIDCLDPAYAPGTGTPVAGGPSTAKMLGVLRQLGALNIVGADVVEVAPAYDHADITAIAGASVAMYYLGLFAEQKC